MQGNVTGLDEKLSDELTSLHVNNKTHFGAVLETVFYTEESYSILPLLIWTFPIYPHDEYLIN